MGYGITLLSMITIKQTGGVGDGRTDDTEAIQKAIDLCHEAGGGVVFVPPGTYMAGPFFLKSSVHMQLDAGATIKAIVDFQLYQDYSAYGENRSEGTCWIHADNARDISIGGQGCIDGQGTLFMESEEPTHFNFYFENGLDLRPQLMQIRGCQRVSFEGVTFRDSAHWGLHFIGCEDVSVSNVRIYNSLKVRNADGIDLDGCRYVRIQNCHIESADDSICIKSRREWAHYGPTEHVQVSNCSLVSTSCAFKIGSENCAGIRNIMVTNLLITRSNRGIGIQSRDEGCVEDVVFSDVIIETRRFGNVWWGKAEPISITAVQRSDAEKYRFYRGKPEIPGPVRRISFHNVSARGENGVIVYGSPGSRPKDILFNRVAITLIESRRYPGAFYDLRPCQGEGILVQPVSGFRFHHSDSIRLTECSVHVEDSQNDSFASEPVVEVDVQRSLLPTTISR